MLNKYCDSIKPTRLKYTQTGFKNARTRQDTPGHARTRQDFCKVVMSQLYSHAPRTLMVSVTLAHLLLKHGRCCLLSPVRADQSEQTGLFVRP